MKTQCPQCGHIFKPDFLEAERVLSPWNRECSERALEVAQFALEFGIDKAIEHFKVLRECIKGYCRMAGLSTSNNMIRPMIKIYGGKPPHGPKISDAELKERLGLPAWSKKGIERLCMEDEVPISQLPYRLQLYLYFRFEHCLTLKDIGAIFDVGQERARQQIRKALWGLRRVK